MPMPPRILSAGPSAAAFPDAEIAIDDLAGAGDHYSARIVFDGRSRACRQSASISWSMPRLKGKCGRRTARAPRWRPERPVLDRDPRRP